MNKIAAFDLEIAKLIPQNCTDWFSLGSLGITCLGIALSDSDEVIMFSGVPQIDKETCIEIVDKLEALANDGYMIVGFNSAGFDFRVLAFESELHSRCVALAMNHVDIFFAIFCIKGYCKGLDKISKAHGLTGKQEGVNGAMAPQMWLDGRYHEVLDYCAADVEMTLELARQADAMGFVHWTANDGSLDRTLFPNGLLTVAEALEVPEPNNAWMKDPWNRSKFTGWMK